MGMSVGTILCSAIRAVLLLAFAVIKCALIGINANKTGISHKAKLQTVHWLGTRGYNSKVPTRPAARQPPELPPECPNRQS